MAYKIPTDEEVVAAITDVLSKHGIVRSQKRLKSLVDGALVKIDPTYGVSLPRVRKLAVASGFADLEIKSRKGGKGGRPKRCPVCEGRLDRLRNLTLEDKATSFEFKCPRCGYFTGRSTRVPTRYVFFKKN